DRAVCGLEGVRELPDSFGGKPLSDRLQLQTERVQLRKDSRAFGPVSIHGALRPSTIQNGLVHFERQPVDRVRTDEAVAVQRAELFRILRARARPQEALRSRPRRCQPLEAIAAQDFLEALIDTTGVGDAGFSQERCGELAWFTA